MELDQSDLFGYHLPTKPATVMKRLSCFCDSHRDVYADYLKPDLGFVGSELPVWYKTGGEESPEVVQEELQKCQDDSTVARAYSNARVWRGVAWGTILIPFWNIAANAIHASTARTYDNLLTQCMRVKGYSYGKERGGIAWDEMSNKNVTKGGVPVQSTPPPSPKAPELISAPELTSAGQIWVTVFPMDRVYHIRPCPVLPVGQTGLTGRTMLIEDAAKAGYRPCPHCVRQ